MTQQSASSTSSPMVSNGLMGAGVGGAVGLLSTLFKKDRKLSDFVKRTLVGGGVGATAGIGLGGLNRKSDETPTPPPPSAAPNKLNGRSAALAGLIPILGPAAYGAIQSDKGDKLSNALKLGGSSLAGGLPGGIAANMAVGRKNMPAYLLANLLTLAGSSYGTRKMTDSINKEATTQESKIIADLRGEGPHDPLSPGLAALLGTILPGVGPGIQGALGSAKGHRWDNAASMAGASTLGTFGFGIGSPIMAYIQAKRINAKGEKMDALANSPLFKKKASSIGEQFTNLKNTIGQKYDQARTGLGGIQVNPLNPGHSAMMGGAGGAALGGGIGLIKALIDDEDDGIMGTIGKALQGAGIGGLGGAALGGGYSMMNRNKLLRGVENQDPQFQDSIKRIMGNYTVPLGSEVRRSMGRPMTPEGQREINNINGNAGISHLLSPGMVRALERKTNN